MELLGNSSPARVSGFKAFERVNFPRVTWAPNGTDRCPFTHPISLDGFPTVQLQAFDGNDLVSVRVVVKDASLVQFREVYVM